MTKAQISNVVKQAGYAVLWFCTGCFVAVLMQFGIVREYCEECGGVGCEECRLDQEQR